MAAVQQGKMEQAVNGAQELGKVDGEAPEAASTPKTAAVATAAVPHHRGSKRQQSLSGPLVLDRAQPNYRKIAKERIQVGEKTPSSVCLSFTVPCLDPELRLRQRRRSQVKLWQPRHVWLARTVMPLP